MHVFHISSIAYIIIIGLKNKFLMNLHAHTYLKLQAGTVAPSEIGAGPTNSHGNSGVLQKSTFVVKI